MTSPAKPTIGHCAIACSILLAIVCGLEFVMIRNMKDATTAQIQSADARIAKLENSIARIEHRLNTVRTIPLVTSESN